MRPGVPDTHLHRSLDVELGWAPDPSTAANGARVKRDPVHDIRSADVTQPRDEPPPDGAPEASTAPPADVCAFCNEPFSAATGALLLPCLHALCPDCYADRKKDANANAGKWICVVCHESMGSRDASPPHVPPSVIGKQEADLDLGPLDPFAPAASLKRLRAPFDAGPHDHNKKGRQIHDGADQANADDSFVDAFLQPDDVSANACANGAHVQAVVRSASAGKCPLHQAFYMSCYCPVCRVFVCSLCASSSSHVDHQVIRLSEKHKELVEQLATEIPLVDNNDLCQDVTSAYDVVIAELEARKMEVKESINKLSNEAHKMLEDQADSLEVLRQSFQQKGDMARLFLRDARERGDDEPPAPNEQQLEYVSILDVVARHVRAAALSEPNVEPLVGNTLRFSMPPASDIFAMPICDIGIIYRQPGRGAEAKTRDFSKVRAPSAVFGKHGHGTLEFCSPISVVELPNGNLLILEFNNHRLQEVTQEGVHVRTIGRDLECAPNVRGSMGTRLNKPWSMALDKQGRLWVADRDNERLVVMDLEGRVHNVIRFPDARNIAVLPEGEIAVVDGAKCQVVILNACDGSERLRIGQMGFRTTDMHGPRGICPTLMKEIVVADSSNARLQVYSTVDGHHVRTIGGVAPGRTRMNQPVDVTLSNDGCSLLVAEYRTHTISVWALAGGRRLHEWGGEGAAHGQFNHPWCVRHLESGKVVVADTDNNRVQVF